MKKFVIVSLLLGILAGNVFAQLTFSGEAYAGISLEKPLNDTDETIGTNHREKGAPMFNFVAAAARENYGVKLDTNFQVPGSISVNGIYGWVYFLNKSINLSMGKISDGKWVSSLDADHEITWDEVTGFRVDYKTPVAGLNVGVAFAADDYTLEKFGQKLLFGASYVNAMLNTVLAYDLGNNGRILFGLNYTGIDELTSAGVQFVAKNFSTWDSKSPGFWGEFNINEKAGYRIMRPLVVSLFLSQTIYNNPDVDAILTFMPAVSYKIRPDLTASFSLDITTANYFVESQVISLKPCLEYTKKKEEKMASA
jgi:hypothetical protein